MSTQTDPVFTQAVKTQQEQRGSRANYEKSLQARPWRREIDPDLASFLAERDSFYLATASSDGQPYIQHRGGPKGFLRPLDRSTLGFADFAGNRQYISLGNLSENSKAHIFLMDYANRRRVKIWGTAHYVDGDAQLLEQLTVPGYRAKVERAIIFAITAWDINCPAHIQPRYDDATISAAMQQLTARIATLEAQLAAANAQRTR